MVKKIISSSFGDNLKVEIFGASHENHVGVKITGFPKGFKVDFPSMKNFLHKRSPGHLPFTSKRKEDDTPILIGGLHQGVTTGEPVVFHILNQDINRQSYKGTENIPRPAHADYTAFVKYGDSIDMSGGGPFSARMTAPLCVAGFIAKSFLENKGIFIGCHLNSINDIKDDKFNTVNLSKNIFDTIHNNFIETGLSVINSSIAEPITEKLELISHLGDSIGGTIECGIIGLDPGLGGPMYMGLESHLSKVLFGIPGVKGIEFGSGFDGSNLQGSDNNDDFYIENGQIKTHTNNHGGILGGISSGMPIIFRLAFKPTPSISIPQQSVNLKTMENVILEIKGRHDPCIAIRSIPVVESATALALLDLILSSNNENFI